MLITIPQNLKGKELYKFLVANKAQLISQKKSVIKHTDPISFAPHFISTPVATKQVGVKAAGEEDEVVLPGLGQLHVKVVANTAWFCDSGMDVLTDKCYDRSVKEKGILIPHIEDHTWKSTSHVGDVKSVYTQLVSFKDLGFKGSGMTTSLIFETLIREDYNCNVYKFYKNGKINQHSIGLFYMSIGLCINDKDYLPEFELWNKYYDKIINKELVDERGYFWIVPEIKVIENSCVLFGMNELTPTLETSEVKELGTTTLTDESEEQKPPTKTLAWGNIVIPKQRKLF